jgi:transposase-like protein
MFYEMLSKYKKREIEKLKIKARKLYKQGLTLREISKILNKSHQWVYMAIKNEK